MGSFFDNLADIIWKVPARERLVNIGIRPSANSIKHETGCKAGDKCLFPRHKVDEQPKNKPKKSYIPKRRECDDKNAVAIVKSVSQLGCVSQDSDALVSFLKAQSLGETRCRKSWNQFRGYDSLSLRCVMRVSGKRKDHRWEKNVKGPHQRSPYAMKFEDRSHEETERQQRCARSMAWNLAENFYKLKEKDKAAFCFPAEEWVLLAASTKEPEEREFVVDSGESMHMVSKKDLHSAELETMRTSKIRRRWWRPTARCKQEEKPRCMSKNWTWSWRLCFLKKTPAVLSLEDHGYTYHWTSGRKPQLLPKRQEHWLQNIKLCAIRCPWFIDELFHIIHTYFFDIFIAGLCCWRQQIHGKFRNRKKWKYEWGVTGKPPAEINKNQKHVKMKDTKKYRAIYCMNCRTGCRSSEKFWSMKVVLQSHGETLCLDIETLPVLLMNCERKWNRFRNRSHRETWRRNFLFMVLWHGRSCKEMRGKILRTGEYNNSTMKHSRNAMIDDHQFKEEEIGSIGELPKDSSQTVLTCLYLARIGRPDISWSVNKLARSVTKWAKACDRSFARLIFYIHHTCEYCTFSQADHVCHQVGCARSKPQFHTVLRKLK